MNIECRNWIWQIGVDKMILKLNADHDDIDDDHDDNDDAHDDDENKGDLTFSGVV